MKRLISYIPNTITCCNLLSGCVAVVMAFSLDEKIGPCNGLQWFFICVAAAAVFDFCDGLAARLLNARSEIGKELDSLSDLVSFGLAPGMLVFNIIQGEAAQPLLAYFALLLPVFGALRLAKFNIDDSQSTVFKGLPIPANAIFWIGLTAWIRDYYYPTTGVMLALVAIMSLAMVSNIKMFSLKFKNLSFYDNVKRYGIIAAAIVFVALYGISGLAWTIVLYMLISLFTQNTEE